MGRNGRRGEGGCCCGHPLGLLLSLIIEFINGLRRELVDNFISDQIADKP